MYHPNVHPYYLMNRNHSVYGPNQYQPLNQPVNEMQSMIPAYPLPNHEPMQRQQLLMEEAIQIARQHVPGLVVEAELEHKHGRQIFEIDIITAEGVKYEVEIDANSGEVIEISLD